MEETLEGGRGPPRAVAPLEEEEKRDEITGEWRKLHDELNDLYSSPNIIRVNESRRLRWVGYVARMGEKKVVYRVLVGKPEGKRPLGIPRSRWEDNIKMDLQEVGCWGVDGDRWRALIRTRKCDNELWGSLKCEELLDYLRTC